MFQNQFALRESRAGISFPPTPRVCFVKRKVNKFHVDKVCLDVSRVIRCDFSEDFTIDWMRSGLKISTKWYQIAFSPPTNKLRHCASWLDSRELLFPESAFHRGISEHEQTIDGAKRFIVNLLIIGNFYPGRRFETSSSLKRILIRFDFKRLLFRLPLFHGIHRVSERERRKGGKKRHLNGQARLLCRILMWKIM